MTVTILDENDNTPYFTSGSTKLTQISESAPVGDLLETYLAKDDDRTSPNKDVMFMIVGTGNVGDAFEIEKVNSEKIYLI